MILPVLKGQTYISIISQTMKHETLIRLGHYAMLAMLKQHYSLALEAAAALGESLPSIGAVLCFHTTLFTLEAFFFSFLITSSL